MTSETDDALVEAVSDLNGIGAILLALSVDLALGQQYKLPDALRFLSYRIQEIASDLDSVEKNEPVEAEIPSEAE
jgi:hypothetical protein